MSFKSEVSPITTCYNVAQIGLQLKRPLENTKKIVMYDYVDSSKHASEDSSNTTYVMMFAKCCVI